MVSRDLSRLRTCRAIMPCGKELAVNARWERKFATLCLQATASHYFTHWFDATNFCEQPNDVIFNGDDRLLGKNDCCQGVQCMIDCLVKTLCCFFSVFTSSWHFRFLSSLVMFRPKLGRLVWLCLFKLYSLTTTTDSRHNKQTATFVK